VRSGQDNLGIKISVIIPNYNHARYLRKRLDSIDAQTYRNLEVILLDDCSTDGSPQILEEYCRENAEYTKLILNKVNSGSSFRQWKKGIEHSTGDLIWIAESDDYCESHFLERMVREFEDQAVGIAYTDPKYVDSGGTPTEWCFEKYTEALSPGRWNESYKAFGEEEVRKAMGIRNSMVNASSLILRRSAIEEHLTDGDWSEMKLCGDWLLYLKILSNHSVSFVKNAGAYYVQSQDSSGYLAARGESYSREHQMILAYLENTFPDLPPEAIDANIRYMLDHWLAVSEGSLPDYVQMSRYVRYGEHAELKKERNALGNSLGEERLKREQVERAYSSILGSRTWRYTEPFRNLWNKIKKWIK